MADPLMVLEDTGPSNRRHIGSVLGVDLYATPLAGLGIVMQLVAGAVLGWFLFEGDPAARLVSGALLGSLLLVSNVVHGMGHLLGGRLAGSPMTGYLVTMTRHVNLYEDDPDDPTAIPPRVHILRAAGGPALNLIVGVLALLVWWVSRDWVSAALAILNLGFAVGALAPVPSVDGEVIWRELRRREARPDA